MTSVTSTVERIHVERNGTVEIALPAEEAFLLLHPEGERRWVSGWEPTYVHPTEPSVGEGVVFQTTTGEGTATWVQTRFDPTGYSASYNYVVPHHRVTTVDVAVDPAGEVRNRARVTYRMTALSPEADECVQAFGDGFKEYVAGWGAAIQEHVVEGVPLHPTC